MRITRAIPPLFALALLAGCGGGTVTAAAPTPSPATSWDPAKASSPEIQAAASSTPPAATPDDGWSPTSAPDAAGPQDESAVLGRADCTYNDTLHKLTYFGEASHPYSGLRDMRLLIGLYQDAVRVGTALVTIKSVPPNTTARGSHVEFQLPEGFDPSRPFNCKIDAGDVLN